MTIFARSPALPLMILALVLSGCGQQNNVNDPGFPSQSNTAPEVPTPVPPPAETKPAPAESKSEPTQPAPQPDEGKGAASTPAPGGEVKLEKVKFDEFLSRIAANKQAKYTMVDAWATWCPPCVENFPHVVEMHQKYADQGLSVVSLSFDDATDPEQVGEAQKFLNDKKATFRNFLLDEEQGVGFERLDINAIPAVFIYGPDGKEVRRFTMDDPNHQFTYDEVEKAVADLLEGKSTPT